MAEIFPDEGIDYIFTIWPSHDAETTDLQIRLFSSHSATTVVAATEGTAEITESAWTNYTAKTVGSATWGSPADAGDGNGRTISATQVNMGTCGATGGTVNGFYLTAASGATLVAMANFDDATAVVMQENDIIRVTPSITLQN